MLGPYDHRTIIYPWLTNTTWMTHLEDLLLFLEVLQNNTQCNSASSKNENECFYLHLFTQLEYVHA